MEHFEVLYMMVQVEVFWTSFWLSLDTASESHYATSLIYNKFLHCPNAIRSI